MALDYANERFVLLYTRDTTTWKLLDWEARAVLMFLLRKVDRAGVIDVGEDGIEGLAAVIEVPIAVVERAMPKLVARLTVTSTGSAFVLPNFIDAQECSRSDKQRQRDSRERRRAVALSRNVTGESRNVTDGHERSHAVTTGHNLSLQSNPSQPNQAKPEERESGSATPALVLALDHPEQVKQPDAAQVATVAAITRLNLKTGRRFDAGAIGVAKDIRACLKAGLTVDDLFAVIDDRCAAWLDSPKRDELLKPSVLFRPSNAQRYLAESKAGPTTAAPVNGRPRALGQVPISHAPHTDGEQIP